MNSSGQVDGVMVTTSEACLAQVEKKNNQCKARSKPFAVIGVRQREKKTARRRKVGCEGRITVPQSLKRYVLMQCFYPPAHTFLRKNLLAV